MAYYILVTSSISNVAANEVLAHRLERKFWPINERTTNREKVKVGDGFIFYLAGAGKLSQCFVAMGCADSEVIKSELTWPDGFTDINPGYGLWLREISYFKNPVPIKKILKKLSFIKIKANNVWGGYLQGGCITINEKDYNLVISEAL